LAFGPAVAQADTPALAIFDEVAHHLRFAYGGLADPHPGELLPAARAALVVHCAARPACLPAEGVAAIDAVLSQLGDPHTRLVAAAVVERMVRQAEGGGEMHAIGIVVRAPENGLGLVVLDTVAGSPAARAGLERGDRLMAVDGAFLPAARRDRVAVLEAAVGRGRLRMTVLRAGAQPSEIELVAEAVPLDRLPRLERVADGVGWLRIPSLVPADGVAAAVHRLVAEAEVSGYAALIVDLRDDLGGAYAAAVAAAAAFEERAGRVFAGPMVAFGIRSDAGTVWTFDPFGRTLVRDTLPLAALWVGELVVLVNAQTQSCAESLAFELQRIGATVVGEPTAGLANSAVQTVLLSNGMGLVLTVARVFDADGSPLPERVTPDVFVADDLMRLAEGHDDPLEAALDLLGPRTR
jgi:carboxyl-terminal processing protease